MNLIDIIESAELKLKQLLEDYFIATYNNLALSSHGIDHHRRVWQYSRELLPLFADKKVAILNNLPSKLIIASYLHDIGMSVETGIRHGKYSKDLCINFLTKNNLPIDNYQDVLEAIEHHDRKKYSTRKSGNNILTILSLADDLDAFGFIGIYRYLEIYLVRGITTENIGNMIIVNAKQRFDNLLNTFTANDELVQKHERRYRILNNFFDEYNNMIPSYQFGSVTPSGYCGVVEMLVHRLKNKSDLIEFCRQMVKKNNDQIIIWFFNSLAVELS